MEVAWFSVIHSKILWQIAAKFCLWFLLATKEVRHVKEICNLIRTSLGLLMRLFYCYCLHAVVRIGAETCCLLYIPTTQLLLITIIFIYACLQQKRQHMKYNCFYNMAFLLIQYGNMAFLFLLTSLVNMLAEAIDEVRVALLDLVWHI